jgi:hypothetical protein
MHAFASAPPTCSRCSSMCAHGHTKETHAYDGMSPRVLARICIGGGPDARGPRCQESDVVIKLDAAKKPHILGRGAFGQARAVSSGADTSVRMHRHSLLIIMMPVLEQGCGTKGCPELAE